MSKRVKAWTLMIVMTALFAGPLQAAEDAALLKDMTS